MNNKTIAFVLGCILATSVSNAQLISEFRPNPPGSDPSSQTIELSGTIGSSFSGWILSIESDTGGSVGVLDRASEVSGTFDGNGLLTVDIPDLENPSFTLVLVDNFTSSTGIDLDAADSGLIDWTGTGVATVYDAIGIDDIGGDPLYGAALGGIDFGYIGSEPELSFREGSTGDWYSADYNGIVYDASGTVFTGSFNQDPTVPTFGSLNPYVIPEPATISLIAIFGGSLVSVRRRLQL